MAKALLIKSSQGDKQDVQGKWHKFDQSAPYIQGIETGDLMENLDAEILNGMVSGLPSVWARAYMFAYAFEYIKKDANIKTSGLIKYYDSLIEEWKGLAALMAIYPDRITVGQPLYLNNIPNDIYDISSSFGDMLFNDKDLWSNPDKLANKEDENPYIQIIRYNGEPVGATSPHTLFFTSVDFSGFMKSQDVKWFRNGRLCDPLVYGDLNNDKLQKIYLLVTNMINKLPDYEKLINKNRNGKEPISINPIYNFLKQWKQEIEQKGNELVSVGVLDGELKFAAPFTQLFSIRQDLYYKNGIFSFNPELGGEVVDLQKLLLQDEYLFVFEQGDDDAGSLSDAAVYYLEAMDPTEAGKSMYFPVPLSNYGLNIFRNKIGELVSPAGPNRHELRALVNGDKVSVELCLQVDGRSLTPIVKEYKIRNIDGAEKAVIMWPNFVSRDWSSYFLYNEYPSNNSDIKFVPFYRKYNEQGGYDSGEFITDSKGNFIYADDRSDDVEAQTIVRYPVEIATADNTPYEIIRSNTPFAGLEIRSRENGKDRVCGYLIVRKYNDDKSIKDLSHEEGFDSVIVGIDFGSNNSCLSFSSSSQSGVKPITFDNRRVFLSGFENNDPRHEKTALRNELLFFQNESSENGQIKSWVHDHDRKYVPEGMREQEISGGVPIFESNLVIHSMDERSIKTNAGILHHNMKWLVDSEGKERKKAFLKSVWISAVADLYANHKIPSELRWSYPGAFSNYDKFQYQKMYDELRYIPIVSHPEVKVSDTPSTEAEAVCNYALTNISPDSNNIMLGIDVGGSTSDVLILANDAATWSYKLAKQSSLRLAAGMFVNVVVQSESFRNAIYKFHESPSCKIKVANIKNIKDKPQTAPFYLNAVLDRLKDQEFNAFYSTISQSCPQVFGVPAYITGLLMFYSGKLIAKTIKENGYNQIRNVDLLPFGKGGRLFDWLDVYPNKAMATKYYNDCFRAGFGDGGDNITVAKKESIRKDNKSEVSMGLSADQQVKMDESIRFTSDIIGEKGYKFRRKGEQDFQILADDEVAKSEYLAEMNFGIEFPQEFEEFNKFVDIFCDFVGPNTTGILKNSSQIKAHKVDLVRELKNYITSDTEWRKADLNHKNGEDFDFRHSLLVLEGMCFLDKFIIPEIK